MCRRFKGRNLTIHPLKLIRTFDDGNGVTLGAIRADKWSDLGKSSIMGNARLVYKFDGDLILKVTGLSFNNP